MLGRSRNARSFASAQRSWDNMTEEDVYGPDEPEDETEVEQFICEHVNAGGSGSCLECGECEHAVSHDCGGDDCSSAVCATTGKTVQCVKVE